MTYQEQDNNQCNIIKAIGVGGGGIHAVNHMYLQGIEGVTFVVLDTDSHLLNASPVSNRVFLRPDTTHSIATEESESEMTALFDDDTKMVIIVAGMGGETGTDVAPVVARIAREKEVALTIGIVTIPFRFEGTERIQMALAGIEEMRKHVDALFVINNEHLTEIDNDRNPSNAFMKADETLTSAVSSLCGMITADNKLCLDFNDVGHILHKGGNAFIISGFGSGERRVTKALENALESPLLKNCNVFSSKEILIFFYCNPDSESPFLMDEVREVHEFFVENFDEEVDVIWGLAFDNNLEEQVKITILAIGFNMSNSLPMGPKHES